MSQEHSTHIDQSAQVQQFLIGFLDNWATNSQKTREQIEAVRALDCRLSFKAQSLSWDDFDNPAEPRSLFRFIVADRQIRIDQKTAMADRPPFAVITAIGSRAVRLEFYEGHDALVLTQDVRSPELQGAALPRYLESDPQAYDPIAFLTEHLPEILEKLGPRSGGS